MAGKEKNDELRPTFAKELTRTVAQVATKAVQKPTLDSRFSETKAKGWGHSCKLSLSASTIEPKVIVQKERVPKRVKKRPEIGKTPNEL